MCLPLYHESLHSNFASVCSHFVSLFSYTVVSLLPFCIPFLILCLFVVPLSVFEVTLCLFFFILHLFGVALCLFVSIFGHFASLCSCLVSFCVSLCLCGYFAFLCSCYLPQESHPSQATWSGVSNMRPLITFNSTELRHSSTVAHLPCLHGYLWTNVIRSSRH